MCTITKSITHILKKIIKKSYIKLWSINNNEYGNIHQSASKAKIIQIPFSMYKCYVRKTLSDTARVKEYLNDIYNIKNNYLFDELNKKKPEVLIDIGSNIGLSSLSYLENFKSIQEVYGFEADLKNFRMLKKNYSLWKEYFKKVNFFPHNEIVSSEKVWMHKTKNLGNKHSNSSSGTISFLPDANRHQRSKESFEINNFIFKLKKKSIICKIDIEGGEEYLFKKNINWLKNIDLLIIEIHDRYEPRFINSSSNLLRAVNKYNFAIIPAKDILFCFNRNLFKFV